MWNTLSFQLNLHLQGVRNSYTQVFFSDNKWFALMLFLSTFMDPLAGLSGLMCILFTHVAGVWLGVNETSIRNGMYGYNSLMVGLVLGVYFKFSLVFLLILFLGGLMCLVLGVWMEILLYKYKVPYMSFPFLLSIWIMLMATRNYHGLELSERGIYTINEITLFGGPTWLKLYEGIVNFPLPLFVEVYLKSLGAIVFQYNIVSGFLIAVGLLFYSRIAFSLSLIGYTTGFFFYVCVEESFTQLIYSYIGFNFILLAIALGGYFLIPSGKSYLVVLMATPLTAIVISAFSALFVWFQLPMYSFSFNVIALLFLFLLTHRAYGKRPELVSFQLLSPEKNLYAHLNRMERFKNELYLPISLPFYGSWTVSQGYDGGITHKDEYKYALDFVVTDEEDKTYQGLGTELPDFYCYNLPVTAPAAGWVVELKNDVEDNEIGGVNTKENWGNTLVIKHADYLYSKLSHFKKDSFKVALGAYVNKGDVLGNCGSSGRSPEPHMHFQMQTTPYIGSQTIPYPISYFMRKVGNGFTFHSFEVPKENDEISKVATCELLVKAFHFIPGQRIKLEVTTEGKVEMVDWLVEVNSLNQTYIHCLKTNSYAYLVSNDVLHYFTEFYGDKESLLFDFYLAAHKVLLGYYQDLKVSDTLPVSVYHSLGVRTLHDFTAPFLRYIKTEYDSVFAYADDLFYPKKIKLSSIVKAKIGNWIMREQVFELTFEEDKISEFKFSKYNKKTTAVCID